MSPRLNELKKQVADLGITVVRSRKREAKEDYFAALRKHASKETPYEEVSPMLCYDFWTLDPKSQDALWRQDNWILQQKLNGCRLVLYFIKDLGLFAHSRTVSDVTYQRAEYSSHLLFGVIRPTFSAIVDCEVVCQSAESINTLQATTALLQTDPATSLRLQKERNTPLRVHIFDILNWQDEDLRGKKLIERLSYLPEFSKAITEAGISEYFDFPPTFNHKKRKVFDKIIKEGGEGVVFKNLESAYSSKRERYGWVKLKKQIEMSAYVSGFERGRQGSDYANKVSCLVFSIQTEEGPVEIAKISNLPWDLRKEISMYNKTTGELTLEPEILGSVAIINGFEISRNARRLVHPRIEKWCKDLNPTQCVYSYKDLEAIRKGQTGINLTRVVNERPE
jgi:ATP-dependent DNA ligase